VSQKIIIDIFEVDSPEKHVTRLFPTSVSVPRTYTDKLVSYISDLQCRFNPKLFFRCTFVVLSDIMAHLIARNHST